MGKNRPSYHKKYYLNHRDEILARAKTKQQTPQCKERMRLWRERNKEKLKQQKHDYFQKNKRRINMMRAKRREKIRALVLEKMGGRCVRCGYDEDQRALEIDHINGGGNEERRRMGAHYMYACILKMSEEEWKNKYQLLCANCNIIKKYERREFRAKA